MAQTTLPVLTHPGFPQLLESVIGREMQRVERVLAANQECEDCGFLMAEHTFGCGGLPVCPRCSYESPESSYGACDGGDLCYETATVFDLASEQEYCLNHFREVE